MLQTAVQAAQDVPAIGFSPYFQPGRIDGSGGHDYRTVGERLHFL
jgi:hypothetical protein